ncbi:hypothetical protein SODALDRAFT_364141 [Sodiomyces alkalinus F11]|uniref:Pleckstrin homology domain-containing protein n=1 Tax=Sodiomyces alkalinus (strain CBS 110278 / VKM F-3762 / F11) TaxID=1314773 RepID=A0A3N2PJD9_SODAK|nr:hypothetical protein SODALDRAFT_364141 [Sodiomyces alkalinus F11]ROT34643.1 hypothetical protein SODALDRAFT_364141 [Sodiomyces alkalinus F11]
MVVFVEVISFPLSSSHFDNTPGGVPCRPLSTELRPNLNQIKSNSFLRTKHPSFSRQWAQVREYGWMGWVDEHISQARMLRGIISAIPCRVTNIDDVCPASRRLNLILSEIDDRQLTKHHYNVHTPRSALFWARALDDDTDSPEKVAEPLVTVTVEPLCINWSGHSPLLLLCFSSLPSELRHAHNAGGLDWGRLNTFATDIRFFSSCILHSSYSFFRGRHWFYVRVLSPARPFPPSTSVSFASFESTYILRLRAFFSLINCANRRFSVFARPLVRSFYAFPIYISTGLLSTRHISFVSPFIEYLHTAGKERRYLRLLFCLSVGNSSWVAAEPPVQYEDPKRTLPRLICINASMILQLNLAASFPNPTDAGITDIVSCFDLFKSNPFRGPQSIFRRSLSFTSNRIVTYYPEIFVSSASEKMNAWETEDEAGGPAATSLPTPRDTPYRTPSGGSRRSRRSVTPPGTKSYSPSFAAGERNGKVTKRSSKDVSNDENISVLDPRRFTPTLHANLVAEILNLRRDQEEKIKLIESLEATLHSTRGEQESLQETLAQTTKESRSLKRHLALLEGGTTSALGELTRERDEAVESNIETKVRLEAAQRKIRLQEEDSRRVHDLWIQEKDAWEEEKRKYERRIHVVESRLKSVLDEVAAYQNALHLNGHGHGAHNAESETEETGRENDAASVRTMSMTNSIRFSGMPSPGKGNGNSLADELNLDGDDDWHTDDGGRESVLSHHRHHARNMSRDSVMSRLHRRNQSIESLKRPGSVARGKLWVNQPVLEALEDGIPEDVVNPPAPKVVYTDTGTQFSPPPSPMLQPSSEPAERIERAPELETLPPAELEIEANQRRKRVQLNRPSTIDTSARPQHHMVSTSSQTVEEPLSPPKTPKSPLRALTPPPPETKPTPTVSVSTQTEDHEKEKATEEEKEEEAKPLRQFSPMPELPIPSISVIPPTSRPTTPREPRLPQYNKDAGCQVSLLVSAAPVQSTGVQTDEIRVDRRLAQLPMHLRPEAISSRPTSPNPTTSSAGVADVDAPEQFTPGPADLPPRNPRRLAIKRSFTDMPTSPRGPIPPVSPTFSGTPCSPVESPPRDAYPGNNDDGPLSSQKAPMRRPHRVSSLFAGFDANSSDEGEDYGDADPDLSDAEFRTALSAPGQRPKSGVVAPAKRGSYGNMASPEQPTLRTSAMSRSSVRSLGTESYSYNLENKENNVQKDKDSAAGSGAQHTKFAQRSYEKSTGAGANKANGMRRAAMIQSGIATHQGRARSPSLTDSRDPPFPIPTRASSRRPPISASAPSDGQRSPTRVDGSWRRRGSGRSHYRANSIRKVRSAAALPRNHKYRRHGSRSPPPFSETTEGPESPGLPPLPHNDITSPHARENGRSRFKSSHRSQPSTTTAQTAQTYQTSGTNGTHGTDLNSQGSVSGTTGVVDAIAQTMVGEWMFKYVRRRKSFGVPEPSGREETSNDRHKRWVWLAPYERAILWSSKQPSSGSALMGKAGRKRKPRPPTPNHKWWSAERLMMAFLPNSAVTIQSVLDVKDDNPAPKGMPTIFNRSILILTPQRALKFTAVSAERHYLWLTALSFLAHSQQAVPEIITAPPPPKTMVPDFEMAQPKRRPGIRDSIRLTKSKTSALRTATPSMPSVPSVPSVRSNPSAPPSQMDDVGGFNFKHEAFPPLPEIHHMHHSRERSGEAAEAPVIPRFHERSAAMVHGRKRSNTGGHVPPPLSFRGFSGPAVASSAGHSYTNSNAGNSVGTAGSSDIYQTNQSQASSGGPSWGMSTTTTTGSQRTSEASTRPSNFFDAIGTVRMEAFISPLAFSQFDGDPDEEEELRYRARRRSKEHRRRASRSRNRDSYNSRGGTRGVDDWYSGSRTAGEDDFFRDDPFKGF